MFILQSGCEVHNEYGVFRNQEVPCNIYYLWIIYLILFIIPLSVVVGTERNNVKRYC